MNDWQLLQDYSAHGSEAAFRVLTDRHLNLVYSAALRQVNDPQLAEEICQSVFILLARKAGSLKQGIVLAGWLFRTTRFVAAHARRAEQRRQRREQEAFEMQRLTAPDQAWPRLAPALDEALAQLGETDRNALLLRFFEDKSHKETGAALGLNEEAARKRVDRALEKLRGFFAGRGVNVSAAVLASALASHAVKAAPASLASSVATTAFVGASAAPAALPSLARQVLSAWHWTKVKLVGSLAGACAVAVWLGIALTPHQPAGSLHDANGTEARQAAGAMVGADGTASTSPASQAVRAKKPSGQVLRFHVVAKDTGEPVGAAQLAVSTVANGEWRQRYDLLTDASGRAEVPYPPGTGRLDTGVLSWGWGARFATWTPSSEDFIPAEYTLQVERVTNTMGGWLRDAQDRPVAKAEITAFFDETGDSSDRQIPRERFGFVGMEPIVARSDARGCWTCAVIPRKNHGGFALTARHPDFRRTTIIYGPPTTGPDASEPEVLQSLWAGKLVTRMEAGLTLSGRVLDESGQPVAQAVIAHEPHSVEALLIPVDVSGQFAIPKLERGNFDFVVSAPGFGPEYRNVWVHEGMEPLEIRLKPGALLRLRVVDDQGEAVAGARVSLEQWGDHRQKLKWASDSGADGRIQWASAPVEGELELCALKEGWCYTRDLRFKADGEEHLIAMQRVLDVSGFVTDAESGQPILDFKAFPGYGQGEYVWERLDTRKGTDGKFVVRFQEWRDSWQDLSPAPWCVRVEAEGYTPFMSDPIRPDFTGTLNAALRRLDPTGSVRGAVLRPDRQPAVGAEVALLTIEHNASLDAPRFRRDPEDKLIVTADAQGCFSFGPDPKAHTLIAVSKDGFARVRVRDPRQPLAVVLQPWGRIEGIVDADVRALPIESVILSGFDYGRGDLGLGSSSVPDKSGRFVFEFVPPETLCVYLNSGVGKSFHHRTPVTVEPGQTTSVVITNSGWRLKGRFTLAEAHDAERWKDVKAYLNSEAPPVNAPAELSGDAAKLWLEDFRNSAAGRQRALENVGVNIKPAADGSYETEASFSPGEYRLRVVVGDSTRLERQITLTAPTEGAAGLCDLGNITIPAPALGVAK